MTIREVGCLAPSRSGAGLVEVLVSCLLLLVMAVPVSDLLRRSAVIESRVRERMAREVQARGRLADLLATGTDPSTLAGLEDDSTRVAVREMGPDLVAVEASVTWTDGSGRTETVRAARLVARATVALEAVLP